MAETLTKKRNAKAPEEEINTEKYDEYIHTYAKNQKHPFQIIRGFFAGNGLRLFQSIIAVIGKYAIVLLLPIVISNIINIATTPEAHAVYEIYLNVGVTFVFLVLNVVSTFSLAKVFDQLIRSIVGTLRGTMVRKIQQLSISFYKEIQSGKLHSKIMRDVDNIEAFLSQSLISILEITLNTIVAVVITLNRSPVVFLFFIVAIPIAVITVTVFKRPLSARNREYRREMENTQAAVGEMIELIPVTRAHGLQNLEEEKITSRLEQVVHSGYLLDKVNRLFGSISWSAFQGFQILCLAFTGYLAYKKIISVGEVVLYQTYFGQIVGQISNLINMYPVINRGVESVNSVGEVIAATDIENNGKILPLGEIKGNVEFCDVYYRYSDQERWILKDLSFSVKAGESIAFVGDSGSGKSTILNLLIGFAQPQQGRILIDRYNMKNIDLNEYRAQIAVVPQNTILFSGTVRENITYGLKDVTDEEVNAVIKDVGLEDLLASMPNGVDSYLSEHGANLSGGQRQRISIARALIRKPKIIIFDEATSALDSVSEKKVQAATEKMMQQCTTFLVAHRLSTIRHADKIAVVENGAICEMGTYEELMEKQGKFYHLKKLQE